MKAQKKFIAALIGINIMAFAAIPSVITKADTDYTTIDNLVNQAISEQNLYHYNVAYKRIMDLPEGYEKDVLLSRLASIADSVWTRDIKELVQLIDVMAKEKSGRAYDALEAKINKSGIKEIDKQYLYNELYGWGKNTVWTDDYKKAIAAVIKVWNDKTDAASLEAEKAVEELKVQINKEYIIEQLKEARIGVGLLPLTLDSKYFEGKADTAYVENGKSIILDLSKDTKERTVTLKGKFRMLSINAPLATVILEDVDANEITLEDVSNHSLYLKGDTKVQSLIVNDKSDNARIVLQGKSSVVSAEVKSGAKIEVSSDSNVKASFGKLIINTSTKKMVELTGDFKTAAISLQRPANLKVAAIVEKIDVTKDAKDTVITVDQDGKIQELNANTALKVEGTGSLEKVTGPASGEVINSLPKAPGTGVGGGGVPGGGGTGTTNPGYSIDDIAKSVVNSLNNSKLGATLSGNSVILSKKADGEIGNVTITSPVPVNVSINLGSLSMEFISVKSKTTNIGFDYDTLKALAYGASITVNYNNTDYSYTIVFN